MPFLASLSLSPSPLTQGFLIQRRLNVFTASQCQSKMAGARETERGSEKRRRTPRARNRDEVSPFGRVIAASILTETQVSALDPCMMVPLTLQAGRECPVKRCFIQQRRAGQGLHHYHKKEPRRKHAIHINSPHWTQACYGGHKPFSRSARTGRNIIRMH